MPFDIDDKLVVAIASSALFDLGEADQVFKARGEVAYREGSGLASERYLSTLHSRGIPVLAPFAVDQAACLRADGEQRVDSSASSDSVGWTVTDTCTTATKIRRVRPPAVKMSRNAKRWLTRPACIAGVLVSRPNLNARCGRMKL